MSQAETKTHALTSDLGLAIRDFIEGKPFYSNSSRTQGERSSIEHFHVDFVDVSDADNPVVYLDNGQAFMIRLFRIG